MIVVRAILEGFYGGELKAPGKVFSMSEKFMKLDKAGKPQLPSWVESADKPVKAAKAEEPQHTHTPNKGAQVI